MVWLWQLPFDPQCSFALTWVAFLAVLMLGLICVVVLPMSRCSAAVVSTTMLEVLAGFVEDLAAFLEAHLGNFFLVPAPTKGECALHFFDGQSDSPRVLLLMDPFKCSIVISSFRLIKFCPRT